MPADVLSKTKKRNWKIIAAVFCRTNHTDELNKLAYVSLMIESCMAPALKIS